MTEPTTPPPRLRVVVVGGGVAALETMLALRSIAGDRVDVELVAGQRDFVYRPLRVIAPFGHDRASRYDLAALADGVGARFTAALVTAVDHDRRRLHTGHGSTIEYDVLVVACGARPMPALPGAVTFWGNGSRQVEDVVEGLSRGSLERVVFANHVGSSWHLPLYELALLTGAHLERTRGRRDGELTLVTHESEPLEVFGHEAAAAVRALLENRGIGLETSLGPREVTPEGLTVSPGGMIPADSVIAMPKLVGPALPGLPADGAGFVPVDPGLRVLGMDRAFAIGDATTFPVKQGGIAAQQADVVATTIAAEVGAIVEREEFRPVLRGVLLTGEQPEYLRNELRGGAGETSTISREPLWWPPGKIAGRFLSSHLALLSGIDPPPAPASSDGLAVEAVLEPAVPARAA